MLAVLLGTALLAAHGLQTGQTPPGQTVPGQTVPGQTVPGQTPPGPALRSASALVEDQATGELLLQKNAESALPIASITKLMTAMVVLDAHLDLQEPVTILEADRDVLRHSRSRLPIGTTLTRGDALLLALMASENRAAHALGRTYPQGLAAFVAAMNAKAAALGLGSARFEDPAGLSSGNVASARDLAKIVDAAHHYPEIRTRTTTEEAEIPGRRGPIPFHNTNRLLQSSRWRIGLSKTGFIDQSGECLVMQAELHERPTLIVLLDSTGRGARFGDADRIRQWLEGSDPLVREARVAKVARAARAPRVAKAKRPAKLREVPVTRVARLEHGHKGRHHRT
jgi:D-alanyl-D-alanine endopeptidase (penicillin-binding protein 7)